jgi:dihydrofolate synthase/folylpolyglutamate synthase
MERGTERPSDVILERLLKLHPKLIDLSLDRVERLLERLGSPQKDLPPVIHIAGTNGKGSTLAFLRAIFEAAGMRVHAYTSPHLVRFHERIVLAGKEISEETLAILLSECERRNEGGDITFFEITTAAAFLAFANVEADVLLLETGLGGRLDATNLIERPAATVITPVSMDHMQFLGEDLAAIAGEKAAIQKKLTPSIIGPQAHAARKVILDTAAAIGAHPFVHGRDWDVSAEGDGFAYSSHRMTMRLPAPSLAGAHQRINAGTAIACIEKLPGDPISDTAIAEGLTRAVWPGRLDRIESGSLAERLPPGWELRLDGGHNPDAGKALAAEIARWHDRPLHIITGMLTSKNAAEFLRPLGPHAASLTTIAIPGESASYGADDLAETARRVGIAANPASDLVAALDGIAATAPSPARILICGSLYLMGHVFRVNGTALPPPLGADTETAARG